ncbi:c-type cytochrome [Pseudoduganella sp. UC29_106]|uniref:c-type cytochrome n=1 Tax=Pseudoduganella sp. UC29_106 TaxID=3374553 RepID=UPI0037567017
MTNQFTPTAMLLAAVCLMPLASGAADDVTAGKNLATNHCVACHTFGKGEPAGQGPNLFGIVGRKAASAEGFAYSEGFRKAMANRTWDPKLLDQWLTDTQAVAPGSGMVYFQDDAAKRAKILRYLSSLK